MPRLSYIMNIFAKQPSSERKEDMAGLNLKLKKRLC
jgi:hypothetical protein